MSTTKSSTLLSVPDTDRPMCWALILLLACCVQTFTQARTPARVVMPQDTTITVYADGRDIVVSYTKLAAGQPGNVTFTLPASSLKSLTKGKGLTLSLPQQEGLVYDRSTLSAGTGLSHRSLAYMLGLNKAVAADILSFSCSTVVAPTDSQNMVEFRIVLINN